MRLPAPPTRRIEILDSGDVERGEIPVVEIPTAVLRDGCRCSLAASLAEFCWLGVGRSQAVPSPSRKIRNPSP